MIFRFIGCCFLFSSTVTRIILVQFSRPCSSKQSRLQSYYFGSFHKVL
jgi:hypothetical protein